jgi:uncharacterized protein
VRDGHGRENDATHTTRRSPDEGIPGTDGGRAVPAGQAVPTEKWVVVDEIQRLPNLLNEVHRFIEGRKMRFVLCGSSTRKLKRADVNLLAGRALHRSMHPFVPEELGAGFRLDDALRYGLLPLVWNSTDREDTLSAYARLYLKEEVQAEALVRNLPGFEDQRWISPR